jgi:hypothetical protein
LIVTLLVLSGAATGAKAAGDGKSAALANELRALSATNAQTALQVPQETASKSKKRKAKTTGEVVRLKGKAKSKQASAKRPKGGTKVASVGAFVASGPLRRTLAKKSGALKGNVSWSAPSGCVPAALKAVLYQVSQKFGPVVVNSSVRGVRHNRRVGGARRSWHLRCMAVDFRVHGNSKGLWAFLRGHPIVGGLHRYPLGFFHIDLGPKRTW